MSLAPTRARAWRRLGVAAALAVFLPGCGREIEYYGDGVRRAEGRIAHRGEHNIPAQGERETGPWTWWYPNGERREAGTLERGRRVGTWTQWYPNGQRRSQGQRAWDEAGHASPREGAWTLWHENGEIQATGIYRAGRREGHWDFTLDDGSLDGDRTGEYHDDARID